MSSTETDREGNSAGAMTFFDHIEELRTRLIRMILVVAALSVFFFSFGLKTPDESICGLLSAVSDTCFGLSGSEIMIPWPTFFDNMATGFLNRVLADLKPGFVQVIFTTPEEALLAVLYTALFLGVALGMPEIVYEVGRFVNPGLVQEERRLLARVTIPAVVLFALGTLFAYVLVIPWSLDFLYTYSQYLDPGSQTLITISVSSFVSWVLLFVFAFGLSFQLPLVMVGLTYLGLVDHHFWRENVMYAILVVALFGAFITPDGSGITMLMVMAPLTLLYLLGYVFSRRASSP